MPVGPEAGKIPVGAVDAAKHPCNFWDAAQHGLQITGEITGGLLHSASVAFTFSDGALEGENSDPDYQYRLTIQETNVQIDVWSQGSFLVPGTGESGPPTRSYAFEAECAEDVLTGKDSSSGEPFTIKLAVEPPAEPLGR